MNIMQVITDYVARSILTTKGDLIVRGAALPERLAAGLVGSILRGKGAGELPAFEQQSGAAGTVLKGVGAGSVPTFGVPSIAEFPRASGFFNVVAAGTEVISGLSFAPKIVIFLSTDPVHESANISIGFEDLDGQRCIGITFDGLQCIGTTVYSIYIIRDAANVIDGAISVWAADGFEVTFSEAGSSGADVFWYAIG